MTTPPSTSSTQPNSQGASILLLGFLIFLISISMILTVRVHARLGALTDELIKLNAKFSGELPAAKTKEITASPSASPVKGTEKSKPKIETAGDAVPTPPKALGLGERRSPIPQPGEEITKPLKPATLGEPEEVKPIAAEPKAGEVIPWDQAHLHMGRTITVEGKIITTKRLATICFLNFTNEASGGDSFYLVVFKDNFDDWGGFPEQAFLNKTVRVTGKIEDHKGRAQLKINKKEQVEKME